MASMSLTLSQFDAKLAELARPINDFTPVLKQARQIVKSATLENFAEEKNPDGDLWEKLRPVTIKLRRAKRKRSRNEKILRDTAMLAKSMTGTASIDEMTKTSLEWGTNSEYAGYHMTGTGDWVGQLYYGNVGLDESVGGMVARPFLGINQEMEEDIESALLDFVERKIGDVF